MPTAAADHAPLPAQSSQSRKMEAGRSTAASPERQQQQQQHPKICDTDDSTVTPQPSGGRRKVEKQSMEYVLRSGLAGGLAGCAVMGPSQEDEEEAEEEEEKTRNKS